MAQSDTSFEWETIAPKLHREKKAALIHLLQELTAVSPEVQRFLQTRYQKAPNLAAQVAPYRQVIKQQFVISDWNNTVSWNFGGVQKALDDYARSSQENVQGLCELVVVALETAVAFADSINLQDDSFEADVTVLAERYLELLQTYSHDTRRLEKLQITASQVGCYTLVEVLDELIN